MELRDAIQRIALEWPSYGRPRIPAELRRRGWTVNPKRVHPDIAEENTLVRARAQAHCDQHNFIAGAPFIRTWLGEMALTGVDQLWRADITYVRLREEFIYLAVILDAFSRRVIGWALDRTLENNVTRWQRCGWRWRAG